MHLDELWELSDLPANVHAGGRVRDLDGVENGLEPFIVLILLRHVSDLERTGVE